MKFDKFMNFCFKGLCLCLACFILAGFCVSCFHTPVTAHAWEPGQDPVYWAQQANDYREQLEEQLVTIENAVLTDIKNGNLDQTSAYGQQLLKAIAIQAACLYSPTFQTVFHATDLALQGLPSDLFDNPSEISVSGSGTIGMYLDNNSNLQFANMYKPADGQLKDAIVICSSPDFTFTLSSDNPINVTGVLNSGFCGISYWLSYSSSGYSHRVCTIAIWIHINKARKTRTNINNRNTKTINIT